MLHEVVRHLKGSSSELDGVDLDVPTAHRFYLTQLATIQFRRARVGHQDDDVRVKGECRIKPIVVTGATEGNQVVDELGGLLLVEFNIRQVRPCS